MSLKQTIWQIRKKVLGNPSVQNSDVIPIIRKHIPDDIVTVLDVGCAKLHDGNDKKQDILFSLFDNPKYKITGIDAFKECVEWRKNNGPPGKYLQMNASEILKLNQKFDLVICHHVIEHVPKSESEKMVNDLESLTKKILIIGTPIGFTDTSYAVKLHNNPYELHKCGWYPEEFQKRGYDTINVKQAFLAFLKK